MSGDTILLVEDNPSDIGLTRRAFQRNRIHNELVVVEDGRQALDYLHGRDGAPPAADVPVLILLDLKLPQVEGLEVLRAIRAHPRTHRVPVVILTSSAEEQDIAAGYDLGTNSYIRKPVDFQSFADIIHQLGMYWLVVNQRPPKD